MFSRRDYPWWTRAWWWIGRTWSDLYYSARAVFFPHNIQKIRNVPRTWNDRSERLLHCVFSMLCDFVEREVYDYGTKKHGRDGLIARLAWLKIDDGNTRDHYDREMELLRLYDWYTSRDWKNEPAGMKQPSGKDQEQWDEYFKVEEAFDKEQAEMLARAVKNCGCWWT